MNKNDLVKNYFRKKLLEIKKKEKTSRQAAYRYFKRRLSRIIQKQSIDNGPLNTGQMTKQPSTPKPPSQMKAPTAPKTPLANKYAPAKRSNQIAPARPNRPIPPKGPIGPQEPIPPEPPKKQQLHRRS